MTQLRSFIFKIFVVATTLALALIGAPALLFGKRPARAMAKFWARIILGGLNLICGVTHRLEGRDYMPTGGAIVAANHQSMWETLALYALLPAPVMIFKKELLKIPIYGWWLGLAGNIMIERHGGAKTLRTLQRAAAACINDGEQVIVFPEGTRLQPGETARYKPGVAGLYAVTGVPCTPVAHDSGRYWRGDNSTMSPGEITMKFLPPIAPGLDRRIFLKEIQARIDAARPDLRARREGNDRGADDTK